jgi:hypothetical protein
MNRIPEPWWEHAGTLISGVAWISISAQAWAECRSSRPSTLSFVNICGFLAVFVFWTLYGLRFRRRAIFVGNAVACVMQGVLLVVWLVKMPK